MRAAARGGGRGSLDLPATVQIPWHFRCPISLELMRDPVTVSTGQTYDRSSIESWVATGNTTCPVTRSPLIFTSGAGDDEASSAPLIPNHTLRRLIQEWCVAHRPHGVERIPTPKQPADPALIRRLAAAASGSGGSGSRSAAIRRLRAIARESERDRAAVAAGARSAISAVAFGDPDSDLAAEALMVLAVLPISAEGEAAAAAVAAAAERIGAWLVGGEAEVRASAAVVVEAAAAAATEEGKEAIGGSEGVMLGLVWTVEQRESEMAARAAVRAIFALCLARGNRGRAVAAGAAPALIGRLREMVSAGEGERALAAVELICRGEGGRDAVVEAAGSVEGVRTMVWAMAGARGGRASEHAAGALAAVVAGSEELQREAVAAGVVGELLVMVQGVGCCSDRARRKAQLLLKILRPAWAPMHDPAANSDEFLQPF